MPTLTIDCFSSLERASVELGQMTYLIGPQASGKSIISKMTYFFYEMINNNQYQAIEDLKDINGFKDEVCDAFTKWFPAQAWGDLQFVINFETGPIAFTISRHKRKAASGSDGIALNLSSYFENMYKNSLDQMKDASKKPAQKDAGILPRQFQLALQLRRTSQRQLSKDLGPELIQSQIFVPAGRSSFTSVGRALVAFEQAGLLDPPSLAFGRLFVSLREQAVRRAFRYVPSTRNKLLESRYNILTKQIFDGEIKYDRDSEYVETTDGRKVPFSILSSGHQELLPLWEALHELIFEWESSNMTYIEEPEAHLFPATQSTLVDYLATIINASRRQRMLITTHSPYVLSSVNNLLKAGSIARKISRQKYKELNKIIPQYTWLAPGTTKAYAIIERKVVSILDEDGLIDGEYLDHISGEIAAKFTELLELESSII